MCGGLLHQWLPAGNQTSDVRPHTMASSSAESDNDVVVMDTTSKYFEIKERSKRGKSETPPVTKDVQPSSNTKTPPTDILAKMVPTQQRVSNVKPQDRNSSQKNFVPRKGHSPENDHSHPNDSQVAATHRNVFAKNPLSSGGTSTQSKSSGSSGKAKPRLPKGALNTTPMLSKSGFSFSADEKPAAKREAKAAKQTSQSVKNSDVRIGCL